MDGNNPTYTEINAQHLSAEIWQDFDNCGDKKYKYRMKEKLRKTVDQKGERCIKRKIHSSSVKVFNILP